VKRLEKTILNHRSVINASNEHWARRSKSFQVKTQPENPTKLVSPHGIEVESKIWSVELSEKILQARDDLFLSLVMSINCYERRGDGRDDATFSVGL
jgi:hypothetical protein